MFTPDHSLMALAGELSKHLPLFLNILLAIPLIGVVAVVVVGGGVAAAAWGLMTVFAWGEPIRSEFIAAGVVAWVCGNIVIYEKACAGGVPLDVWLHLNLAFVILSVLKSWCLRPNKNDEKDTSEFEFTNRAIFKSIK